MGNTTIVELDHDRFEEIEKNKLGFAEQILEQLRAGTYDKKEILGGEIVTWFHRSGKIYVRWVNFKKRLREEQG